MPTYVYKFLDSGETIEVQQSFQDNSLTEYTHPTSGAVLPVKKVFQPVGVTFKGSGFFKNDNRGKSSSTTPSGASNDTSGSSSSSDSGSSNGSSDSGSSSGSSSDSGSKKSDSSSSGASKKSESASKTTSSSKSSD